MTKEELIEQLNLLCEKSGLKLKSCIPIGRDILVLMTGDNCVQILSQFLSEQSFKYTTPHSMLDAIGTYIRL